jgi:hypothetical protein
MLLDQPADAADVVPSPRLARRWAAARQKIILHACETRGNVTQAARRP